MVFSQRVCQTGFSCLVLASLLIGCSDSKYNLAPVEGTVTIDGQPYTGKVIFYPVKPSGEELVAGRPSFGKPNAEGRFSLSCYKPNDGAVVGEHTVSLFRAKGHEKTYPQLKELDFNRVPYPGGKVLISANENNNIVLNFTSESIRLYGTTR